MTLNAFQLPAPGDWQAFERFTRDLFAAKWKDANAQLNGRTGQAQAGVDVFGTNSTTGMLEGAQCKGKDGRFGSSVTIEELRDEVQKAKTFQPKLSRYFLVTSGPADVKVQAEARLITEAHMKTGDFEVLVMGWEQLVNELEAHPAVARLHFQALHVALSKIHAPAELIAICHQTFQTTANLFHKADPVAAADGFHPVLMDGSMFYADGVLDARGALLLQNGLSRDLNRQLAAYPRATLAYLGIAHIPLIMHAGAAASTKSGVRLYELNDTTGEFLPLIGDAGPDLDATMADMGGDAASGHAVIRVEVSYNVPLTEVIKTVAGDFRHIRVGIAAPAKGVITHTAHVDELARKFRQALDLIHNENPDTRIHVFIAAPVSVCFRMGQQVSKTIHKSVRCYNYSQRSSPPYHWAVNLVAAENAGDQLWVHAGDFANV